MPSHTDLRLGHVTCLWTLASMEQEEAWKSICAFLLSLMVPYLPCENIPVPARWRVRNMWNRAELAQYSQGPDMWEVPAKITETT